ncbi:MAG: DUF1343 domain-containing protein [Fusobacteria bacterium]|nr:DUF1343 domain-containing protein [Fusobacteriota bacterium]
MRKILICLIIIFSFVTLYGENNKNVILGIDLFLIEGYKKYIGKNIGLITNQTGITSKLTANIDEMYKHNEINLVALYCPEHGIRGASRASETIKNEIDSRTNLPIISLYGKYKKPTEEMLKEIDVLIYDIQDIGVRTYTYIYTMAYAMEASKEFNKEFLVLDRPIAMYGNLVDGNILEEEFSSFIGLYPIPYIYGMTVGELAVYLNTEFNINANLSVIKMENYNHEMDFSNTNALWIPTSPHIPTEDTSYYYATTGSIGELGTISNGVGYTMPFKLIGQEWIDSHKLETNLNKLNLEGVKFREFHYKPFYTSLKDKIVNGVQVMITDKKRFKPFITQLHILYELNKLENNPGFLDKQLKKNNLNMFDKSFGTDKIRKAILDGKTVDEIVKSYEKDLEDFKKKREKYLLYE